MTRRRSVLAVASGWAIAALGILLLHVVPPDTMHGGMADLIAIQWGLGVFFGFPLAIGFASAFIASFGSRDDMSAFQRTLLLAAIATLGWIAGLYAFALGGGLATFHGEPDLCVLASTPVMGAGAFIGAMVGRRLAPRPAPETDSRDS